MWKPLACRREADAIDGASVTAGEVCAVLYRRRAVLLLAHTPQLRSRETMQTSNSVMCAYQAK